MMIYQIVKFLLKNNTVYNIFKSSKNGKSPGYDEIPFELYRNQTKLITLTRMFNVCFNSGKVHSLWSKGLITDS